MHVCVRTGRTSTSTGEQALWGQDVYFARCVLAAVFALGKRSDAVEPCNLTPAWGSIPAIQDSEETEMQRGPQDRRPHTRTSATHSQTGFAVFAGHSSTCCFAVLRAVHAAWIFVTDTTHSQERRRPRQGSPVADAASGLVHVAPTLTSSEFQAHAGA